MSWISGFQAGSALGSNIVNTAMDAYWKNKLFKERLAEGAAERESAEDERDYRRIAAGEERAFEREKFNYLKGQKAGEEALASRRESREDRELELREKYWKQLGGAAETRAAKAGAPKTQAGPRVPTPAERSAAGQRYGALHASLKRWWGTKEMTPEEEIESLTQLGIMRGETPPVTEEWRKYQTPRP